MIFIGYIVWVALSIWLGVRVFQHVHRGRVAKHAAAWSAGVLMALLPYWDVIVGLPITTDVCRNRAGLHAYENISLPLSSVQVELFVPIFGCADCMEILRRGYASEVQVTIEPEIIGRYAGMVRPTTMITRPGPTRYWISSHGDPHCEGFYTHFAPTEQDQREFWERGGVKYRENACVAAESLPSLSANFTIKLDAFEYRRSPVSLVIREATLTRQGDASHLASLAKVVQFPWTARAFLYGLPPVPQCPSSEEELTNNFGVVDLLDKLASAEQGQGASNDD